MTINDTDRTSISARTSPFTKYRVLTKPLLLVAGAALIAGCTATGGSGSATSTTATGSGSGAAATAAPAPDITADLASITTKDVAKISPTRLADGLVAPTNRWFSGLVFGDKPQPVFPLPLSAALTDQGFALGLPTITDSAKTIMGGTNPQIQVPLGASSMKVTGYDTLTVTSTYYDGSGSELGSVLLAQGSPFVTYTAASDQTLAIEPIFKAGSTAGLYTTNVAGHDYGLVVGGGASVDDAGKVTLTSGSTITLYGVPDGADAASLATAAADPVTGGSVDYSVDGDQVTTTLKYTTKNGGDTAIMPMAGQTVATGTKGAGSYQTIYGTADVYTGTSLTTSAPLTEPSYQLDVSNLSDEDKAALVEQVKTDAAAIDFTATDTYFGGKYLYRGANLMTLAEQLGVDDVAKDLRTKLTAELTMWFDPKRCATEATKCFVYDDQIKSLIGQEASFGSDELNDHHFHYGYLIYAAAVVSANDSALADKIAPVVDLAVADIASAQASSAFPQYRNFDPYSGHAWASGSSPFADGNNQESSSEAVNAWNAVALWAKVRGNTELQNQATWMMSTEANAAKLYWTNTDTSEFPAFTGSIAALNWGGKRDYATWFSAEPGAMLGIQLLPMGSYSTYLAGDADRIKANLEQGAAGGYGVQFGEYMAQYLALADPAAARSELANLPAEIDNATTKSYVMAYVFSRSDSSGS
ncbi:MAG TPA: glycosyl hydrolase [Nakamurella multipartita]|nr:glycosyl hydrolase [Nakamurella multipartita]